jgi:hypothetical protein
MAANNSFDLQFEKNENTISGFAKIHAFLCRTAVMNCRAPASSILVYSERTISKGRNKRAKFLPQSGFQLLRAKDFKMFFFLDLHNSPAQSSPVLCAAPPPTLSICPAGLSRPLKQQKCRPNKLEGIHVPVARANA